MSLRNAVEQRNISLSTEIGLKSAVLRRKSGATLVGFPDYRERAPREDGACLGQHSLASFADAGSARCADRIPRSVIVTQKSLLLADESLAVATQNKNDFDPK